METIAYRTIKDASSADMEKMPYKIKCRGLIFKKEYNWYYSKKYSLDDIANNGDDCEIIEWEEPEITQEEILQQRIDKAIKYIKHHIPIIIQFEDGGWCNANIEFKNGVLIITPDNKSIFDGN